MSNIEIIPAILPHSFKDLQEHVERLQGVAPRVQVDLVDGSYARGKTWPYRDHATFEKLVSEEHGLPHWERVDYQFDLMVADPAAQILDFIAAGATSVVLHARSETALQALQQIVDRRDQMGTFAVQAGVALGDKQQPDALEPFESQFDFVQVMGIDHEGKQGEAFDQHALYLVERVRARYPLVPIQVDGGVSPENALALVAAGATRLIVGSAIFKEEDPAAAYKELYNMVNAK